MDVEAFARWLHTQPLRGTTPATYITRMRSIAKWAGATGVDLRTCTPLDLVPLVADTPNTYSSRVLLKAVLKWWWRFIERPDPPISVVVVPPKPVYSARPLTADAAHRLAETAWGRHPDGTAILAGFYLGIRVSEIAAMEWSRFGDGEYHVLGKGLKERWVPVANYLEVHLRNVEREHPRWVFPGSGEQPHVHRSTVWKWVQRIAREAGVPPVAPHRMRHTFGTTLNDKTGDFRTTQELMGHNDPKTTMLYVLATKRKMRSAIDALDFQADPDAA